MALLSYDEQRQVSEAVSRVELKTDAELVTVLAARSDDYAYVPLIWAGLLALLVPGVFSYFTGWFSANQLLLAQFTTFIVAALIMRLPSVTTQLIPKSVRHWRASNMARRHFLEQNLHRTAGETGVLIFVSEAERYVEILVDRGISRQLDDVVWRAMVDVFTEQVREGETLKGFLDCIESCGDLLATHVPLTQTRNELPNRLVVLE